MSQMLDTITTTNIFPHSYFSHPNNTRMISQFSPSYSSSSYDLAQRLCLLMLRLLLVLPLVTSHGHLDFEPEALTIQHGFSIPQTCILVSNKRKRCYYTFVPECAKGHTPVVYDIHDYDDSPLSLSVRSGWLRIAQQECFIIVWPIVSNIITPQNPFLFLCACHILTIGFCMHRRELLIQMKLMHHVGPCQVV
jgi:hypothetical protein